MNFLLYESKEGKTRVLGPAGILSGGVEAKGTSVTVYSPKIPPLTVICDNPAEAQALLSAIVMFVAGHPGVPGVREGDYFNILNINSFFAELREMDRVLESSDEVAEEEDEDDDSVDLLEVGG